MNNDKQNPKPNKSFSDKAVEKISDLLKVPEVPLENRLAVLTDDQKKQIEEIENRVICGSGYIDETEAAIGMLRVGHHFGWKVLYIVHSKKTIRKYEEILGVKIRDIFPAEGPSAARSTGLKFAKTFPNFWKVVSGDIKITNRKEIE